MSVLGYFNFVYCQIKAVELVTFINHRSLTICVQILESLSLVIYCTYVYIHLARVNGKYSQHILLLEKNVTY